MNNNIRCWIVPRWSAPGFCNIVLGEGDIESHNDYYVYEVMPHNEREYMIVTHGIYPEMVEYLKTYLVGLFFEGNYGKSNCS